MSEFKVHNISLGLPGVENKAIAPKKDVKKKIVNNPKSLKFALAGLSVLGMAAAAGIMIYRGKLNTEDLNNLASKTKDKVAQQAGQTVRLSKKVSRRKLFLRKNCRKLFLMVQQRLS